MVQFHRWILSSLLQLRRRKLVNMINFSTSKNSFAVEMGCNTGQLARLLSLYTRTIGIDVDLDKVRWAKKINRDLDFICCDLCNLPFKKASVNLAVCASVFEHVENLEKTIEQVKFVLTNEGQLAAGYPIETRLLEAIIKLFLGSESQVWNQCNISKHDKPVLSPHIHRQSFLKIRMMLKKSFSRVKKEKIPLTCFSDLLSIYENAIFVRTENQPVSDDQV